MLSPNLAENKLQTSANTQLIRFDKFEQGLPLTNVEQQSRGIVH